MFRNRLVSKPKRHTLVVTKELLSEPIKEKVLGCVIEGYTCDRSFRGSRANIDRNVGEAYTWQTEIEMDHLGRRRGIGYFGKQR